MTNNFYSKFVKEFGNKPTKMYNSPPVVLHSAIGISGEAGELLDTVKKHVFYGKPLDTTNVVEEMGDILFYIQMMCNHMGLSLDDVVHVNIKKLKNRYPDGFSTDKALNRNTSKEREVMDDTISK